MNNQLNGQYSIIHVITKRAGSSFAAIQWGYPLVDSQYYIKINNNIIILFYQHYHLDLDPAFV